MSGHTLSDRKQLLQLTWPLFLELVLFSVIGSMDTIMLSGYADNAVGAVGVANQIMSLFNVVANIVTAGTGILCAQYIGAGRTNEEKQPLILGALMVNCLLGALFSLVTGAGAGILLDLMNVDPAQYGYAKEYLSIVGGFLFLQMLAMTFTVLIRSHGNTRATMGFSLTMNLINVVLNYVLIYGHFGFPRLGVAGAAIATVVCKICGCLMSGGYFFGKIMPGMSLKPRWRETGRAIGKVLAIGSPAAGEQISYTASKLVVMGMVTGLGPVAVNTYSYVNTIVSYVYLFSISVGQGASIMVGWEAGKRRTDRAMCICRHATNLAFFSAMALLGLLCLFREQAMDLFADDPAVIAMGGTVILADFVLESGRSRNLVLVNALRAAGDVRFPLYVGLFSMWFFSVGASWVLGIGLGWGLVGIWIGLGLDECFRALLMQIRWNKGHWTRFVMTE